MGENFVNLNLLELLLASMKGGAKYPYELNYLAGTLANLINPTEKRTISLSEQELGTAMIADLKDLYNCINVGKSWRGINPVIAICNPTFDKLGAIIKDTMVEEVTKSYPLVGSTLGSLNAPFGGKDEIIIIGNYNNEDLMKLLRQSLYPQLKVNYDIPNGFISRALHELSEASVRDIGRYNEGYGKNYYVARSLSLADKVVTNFYYSPNAVPEEVVKREFMFNCISTDPQYGNAPFMVKSQLIQGTGTPKVIDINSNKIIGFSNMEDTRVMQKLFSGKDEAFTKNFSDAITLALKNGKATMTDEGRVLNFSEMDGSVMVEDPAMGQVTQAAPNPNVPGDMQLQAVQGGAPVATDPNAGMMAQPMAPGMGAMQPFMDPNTGQPMVDPNGMPVMMDPQTGQPMMTDPNTGQLIPAAIDPNSGQVVPIDPNTGMPMQQPMIQGQPAGVPPVDPNTGQPMNIAPADPSAMQQGQPYEFSAAGQQQFSNNTELMNKLMLAENYEFNRVFSDAIDRAFETGKAKMFSGGKDGRMFNLGRVVNPKTGIPEVIVQDYSNKGLQLTRVFADTKNNRMRLNSIEVSDKMNMVKQFSDETEIMTRIFSNTDPQFNADFSRAVLRAYSDGKAHMYSDKTGKEIMLTRVYGDVVAEDEETGELTGVTPDEEGDLNLVALDNYGQDDSEDGQFNDGDVPYDDIVDNLEDRDAMEPEFYNTIDAGIVDPEAAGLEGNPEDSFEGGEDESVEDEDVTEDRDFSIDAALFGDDMSALRMFATDQIENFVDVAGEVSDQFEPDAEVKVSPRGAVNSETMQGHKEASAETKPKEIGGNGVAGCVDSRCHSDIDEALGVHMYSDEDVLTDIAEKANEIQSGVEELAETKDKEMAEELQDKVEDLKKELEIFENDDDIDTEDVKAQCRKYSKFFSDIISGKYDDNSLEHKTVSFSKVETPTFAPSSNLLSMLFSGTGNEELIDEAQAMEVDPSEAPEGDFGDVDSYQEQAPVEEAPALEAEPAAGDEGSINVSIDPDNTINIEKSFSDQEGDTKTFAQNAYVGGDTSDSLFSNCLTCDL